MVDVVITAYRFIGAETGQVAAHRAGHTEAGVAFHIIGADVPLEQFVGEVSLFGGSLPGAVKSQGIRTVLLFDFLKFTGNQGHRFLPGGFFQLTVFSHQRMQQAVFSVNYIVEIKPFNTE